MNDDLDGIFEDDGDKGPEGQEESAEILCEPCIEEQAPKTVFDPLQPTARQLRDHEITHLPYRNWCPWCVKAK